MSDIGRISPGCAGLWNDDQQAGWERVARFAHEWTAAPIGLQLGHSGRKGSTRVMWEGEDQPLADGNWPLLAASAVPYTPANQVPREMDRGDMDLVAPSSSTRPAGAQRAASTCSSCTWPTATCSRGSSRR